MGVVPPTDCLPPVRGTPSHSSHGHDRTALEWSLSQAPSILWSRIRRPVARRCATSLPRAIGLLVKLDRGLQRIASRIRILRRGAGNLPNRSDHSSPWRFTATLRSVTRLFSDLTPILPRTACVSAAAEYCAVALPDRQLAQLLDPCRNLAVVHQLLGLPVHRRRLHLPGVVCAPVGLAGVPGLCRSIACFSPVLRLHAGCCNSARWLSISPAARAARPAIPPRWQAACRYLAACSSRSRSRH